MNMRTFPKRATATAASVGFALLTVADVARSQPAAGKNMPVVTALPESFCVMVSPQDQEPARPLTRVGVKRATAP
jgi:hypothetical protein